MIPHPSTKLLRSDLSSHVHIGIDTCPWCEQEIPPDRLEDISGKIALRERERTLAIRAELDAKYQTERTQADAVAQANLERERQQSAIREAAALAAQASAAEQIHQQLQSALDIKIEQAKSDREAAEKLGADLKEQLEKERRDSAAALAAANEQAAEREKTIRDEAQQVANAAAEERLAASEAARAQSEAALQQRIEQAEAIRLAAEQRSSELQLKLEGLGKHKDAEIAQLKDAAAAEALRIRQEATATAEASFRDQLAANALVAAEATAQSAEAERKLAELNAQQETTLNEQLNAQREVLEAAKNVEINAIKAKAFEDNQKQVDKLTADLRALEKKTNEELGEGAEVQLFEALKAAFGDDQIDPIPKGAAGADIRHIVKLHGKPCGTILYDSKNRGKFLYEHVAKLKADQLADKADHAILSTHKFPKDTRHLHVHDGVVLASPARVVAVVTLIRQHMIQTHTLRISSAERESKTAALYEFITSDRFAQYLAKIDGHADELLKMQVAEKKAHDAAWKKEGEILRRIQKAQSDISTEVSCIIGTAATMEMLSEEAAE